jgi:metal-responsive CopG/Arc/MetJ family transcriptional regulator
MSIRITITLSKEAAEAVARYMEANGVSRSRAINDLIVLGGRAWLGL